MAFCQEVFVYSSERNYRSPAKYEQVYGTEAHKTQVLPHIRWENMPGIVTDKKKWDAVKNKKIEGLSYHKKGPMTVRDFLQYMGTDVMRRIYEPIWVQACIEDIRREEPLLAVIDDCRFVNEIEAIQAEGGKVVGLSRSPLKILIQVNKQSKKTGTA